MLIPQQGQLIPHAINTPRNQYNFCFLSVQRPTAICYSMLVNWSLPETLAIYDLKICFTLSIRKTDNAVTVMLAVMKKVNAVPVMPVKMH